MTIHNHQCTMCKEYVFLYPENHVCPPLWLVRDPQFDGYSEECEWELVYAKTPGEAAENYCSELDRGDGEGLYIRNEGAKLIIVKSSADGKIYHFSVHAEMEPQYSASERPDSPEVYNG